MRQIIYFFLLIIFSSCCTKKHCPDKVRADIKVILQDFNTTELSRIKLMFFDSKTNSLMKTDTSIFTQTNSEGVEFFINSISIDLELRDQFFILQIGTRKDTINNIEYELFSTIQKCNSCFPFGNEKVNVSNFKNFTFRHNRNLISEQKLILKK